MSDIDDNAVDEKAIQEAFMAFGCISEILDRDSFEDKSPDYFDKVVLSLMHILKLMRYGAAQYHCKELKKELKNAE